MTVMTMVDERNEYRHTDTSEEQPVDRLNRGSFDIYGFVAALDVVRKKKQYHWTDVARETNVSVHILARMRDYGSNPSLDNVTVLARWAGVSLDPFIAEPGRCSVCGEPGRHTSKDQCIAALKAARQR